MRGEQISLHKLKMADYNARREDCIKLAILSLEEERSKIGDLRKVIGKIRILKYGRRLDTAIYFFKKELKKKKIF